MAAQTVIAEQVPLGPHVAEGSTQFGVVTFTAGDATNGNKIIMNGNGILLLVRNSGAGAGTVSVASSKDRYGRKADISAFSIAADAIVARVFTPEGWEQVTGGRDLILTPSATTIEFAAFRL